SRDVRLHDNRYDTGFNRRVDVSGMRAGDVTVEDAGFRVGADARTDGLGTVGFTSSDPSVVAVDDDGVVTAVGEGTATLRAVATSETGATESRAGDGHGRGCGGARSDDRRRACARRARPARRDARAARDDGR